jgi:ElaB/YqjD/DUF883 family membrane-anchored ribosome-binding protein
VAPQRIKSRIDPRGWVDKSELRDRFHDAVDAFRHRAEDVGERAGALSRDARHRAADSAYDFRDRADDWFRSAREDGKKALKKHGKTARRYADDASQYARDHAATFSCRPLGENRDGWQTFSASAHSEQRRSALPQARRPLRRRP